MGHALNLKEVSHACLLVSINHQSVKDPRKVTHGQGEADPSTVTRGAQQIMRHALTQAWGAVNESQQYRACATHFRLAARLLQRRAMQLLEETPPQASAFMEKRRCSGTWASPYNI